MTALGASTPDETVAGWWIDLVMPGLQRHSRGVWSAGFAEITCARCGGVYTRGMFVNHLEPPFCRCDSEEVETTKKSVERAEGLLQQRLGLAAKLFAETGTLTRHSTLWPGVLYRVQRGGRVEVIERGEVRTRLCVTPAHSEPEADRLLTILDLIEADESKLWEMANVQPEREERFGATPAPPPGLSG